jgi:dolichol-phosphate mannosyltransferase
MTPELSVVMPVFKEGDAVEPVLRALTTSVSASHEILVVYDFDEDPTVPVIDRLAGELPTIRGLRNDLGRGVLNAMKAGMAASRGTFVMRRVAGLTLHWFAGIATHDPTNNFKLYSRRFLDATPIQSSAGFELALELTVKASLAGHRVAEVPTTWRDRTAGQSNFRLRQWLPNYLHWYRVAFVGRLSRKRVN